MELLEQCLEWRKSSIIISSVLSSVVTIIILALNRQRPREAEWLACFYSAIWRILEPRVLTMTGLFPSGILTSYPQEMLQKKWCGKKGLYDHYKFCILQMSASKERLRNSMRKTVIFSSSLKLYLVELTVHSNIMHWTISYWAPSIC